MDILANKRAWAKQRNADAAAIRAVRKALYSPLPYKEEKVFPAFVVGGCLLLAAIILLMVGCNDMAHAYTDDEICNAIYIAEGGAKTRHPYGILTKYKTTTPRQACINTVRNKYKQWVDLGARGEFIDYLGSKYAPIGASNDPNGLNRHWVRNVKALLAEGV